MKRKSAQLFDEDATLDSVQLKVNDDFAQRLQVSPLHVLSLSAAET